MRRNALRNSLKGVWRFSCRATEACSSVLSERLASPPHSATLICPSKSPWPHLTGFSSVKKRVQGAQLGAKSFKVQLRWGLCKRQGLQLAPLPCASSAHNGRLTRSVFVNTTCPFLLGSVPCWVNSPAQSWDIQSESPSEAPVWGFSSHG